MRKKALAGVALGGGGSLCTGHFPCHKGLERLDPAVPGHKLPDTDLVQVSEDRRREQA